MLLVVGLPLRHLGKLYNCAAVLYKGEILGVVPKTNLPNYDEFGELRWFQPAPKELSSVQLCGDLIPFGAGMLFQCEELPDFTFGVEICEDLWVPVSPAVEMCRNGAAIVVNQCASHDAIGHPRSIRKLVEDQSRSCHCGYILCNAGVEESSTDVVYSGHNLIAEDGALLAESKPFAQPAYVLTEIDVERLMTDRRKMNSYPAGEEAFTVYFSMDTTDTVLTRPIPQDPFLPDEATLDEDCAHIFALQSQGLARRLKHINAATAVIGVSGGLDSTLALLVAAQAMKLIGKGP
jgi:NAD+ synthase (glutamine-hydrolysing)